MARLTLILGVLATVIYLLDGFRFMLNEWRNWRNKSKWLVVLGLMAIPPTLSSAELWSDVITDSTRAIRWQDNVGVSGGIPTRTTVCATLSPVGGDNTPQIVSAINACGTNEIVKLNAGTYPITTELAITKSNVVLRGAGAGSTIIKADTGYTGFYTNGIVNIENGHSFDMSSPAAVSLSSGYTKDSTQIVSSAAHGLTTGDVILIDQRNSDTADPRATCTGSEGCAVGAQGRSGEGGFFRSQGQLNRVTVVDTTTLDLELPLFMTYTAARVPQLIKVIGLVENTGIEDLTIDARDGETTTSLNDTAFSFTACDSCWARRIEVRHGDKVGNTGWGMMRLWHAYRCTIEESKFWGLRTTGTDSYGWIVQPWATANLLENNILKDRPLVIGGPTSGNVFAYNYMVTPIYVSGPQNGETFFHGATSQFNLMEGNYIVGYNTTDTASHGNSNWQTWMRNRLLVDPNASTFGNWLIDIQFLSWYYNFHGNVLGSNGWETIYDTNGTEDTSNEKIIYRLGYTDFSGTWGTNANGGLVDTTLPSTLLRHGNYDYVNDAVQWAGGLPQSVPVSFYLASKPQFFGSCAWPVYGPEGNPLIGLLPAKLREDGSSVLACDGTTSSAVIARVIRWMEVAAFVIGMGWHFRKPLMAVSLAAISGCGMIYQLAPRSYETVKVMTEESAVKVLTTFNHLTKQRS